MRLPRPGRVPPGGRRVSLGHAAVPARILEIVNDLQKDAFVERPRPGYREFDAGLDPPRLLLAASGIEAESRRERKLGAARMRPIQLRLTKRLDKDREISNQGYVPLDERLGETWLSSPWLIVFKFPPRLYLLPCPGVDCGRLLAGMDFVLVAQLAVVGDVGQKLIQAALGEGPAAPHATLPCQALLVAPAAPGQLLDHRPSAQTIYQALLAYPFNKTPAANHAFASREGADDDLILAVGLACWYGEHCRKGFWVRT